MSVWLGSGCNLSMSSEAFVAVLSGSIGFSSFRDPTLSISKGELKGIVTVRAGRSEGDDRCVVAD